MAVSRGESEQNQLVLSGGHRQDQLVGEVEILKARGTTTQKVESHEKKYTGSLQRDSLQPVATKHCAWSTEKMKTSQSEARG